MEKLSPLWENEEFVKSLAAAESEEAALKLFADNGIDITTEELAEIKSSATAQDELGEEDLEDVAGGIAISALTAAGALALGWWVYQQWRKWKYRR
jgi:predicted ribosomally synthesized peptide with nif11-like leader